MESENEERKEEKEECTHENAHPDKSREILTFEYPREHEDEKPRTKEESGLKKRDRKDTERKDCKQCDPSTLYGLAMQVPVLLDHVSSLSVRGALQKKQSFLKELFSLPH
ncbi:MAG: hypothetical protein R6V67_09650 [Spirochaetia bacterium]